MRPGRIFNGVRLPVAPAPIPCGAVPTEPTEGAQEPRAISLSILRKPTAAFLVLVMALGSVVLWIGIPVAWIYGVSQMVDTTQPQLGPYVLILFGVPTTMWLFGRFLYKMNQVYERVTGQTSEVRVQLPWHRSMRGERDMAGIG